LPLDVQTTAAAEKFLKKADTTLRARIMDKLQRLAQDPFPPDSKRIIGREEKIYRVRVGDYRILYVVFFDKNQILVINIDKRSKVYQ